MVRGGGVAGGRAGSQNIPIFWELFVDSICQPCNNGCLTLYLIIQQTNDPRTTAGRSYEQEHQRIV